MNESRVDEIFLRVVDLEPDARERALADLCGDAETRRRVETLLRADQGMPTQFLAGDDPEPAAEVKSGARIGPYRVLERLGEGGMGTVYAALQSFPRRKVALKILRAGRISEDAVRRFHHEIEVLGRLQHPGIAQIHDAGVLHADEDSPTGRELPWFTMELVRGVPLVRYSREQGLDLNQKLELLARVCDAVHYAHQRGVIHRDLKPENVLVTTEESTASRKQTTGSGTSQRVVGAPKVLDFGIARVVDPGLVADTHHTVAGALVGTLSSMSPEQASGDAHLVDVRTDVYALGVMLYELVSGRPPILLDGLSVPQALRKIAEEEPLSPGSIDSSLRGDLSKVALTALAKDPERRYQTALELAEDLRAFARGEPVVAGGDSRMYFLRRSLRRHRVAVGVVSLFAVTVAVFGGVSMRQARAAERLAASETEARRRADADFDRALGAVELLTTVGAERLADIPLASDARRELLEAALELHRGLLEGRPEDEDLLADRGLARFRVARIQRDLGHMNAARAEAELAVEELDAAIDASAPESAEVLELTRVSALTLLGNLVFRTGEAEAAMAHHERAAGLAMELVARTAQGTNRGRALEGLAASHKHLAICLRQLGRPEEALDALSAALPHLEELTDPSRQLRRELAAFLQQRGVIRLETGDVGAALADLERATELAARVVDEKQGADALADLVSLRSNLSVALQQAGLIADGHAQLDLAIADGERLARNHPGLLRPREDLFAAYNNRASIRLGSDELSGAAADMDRAAELLTGLLGPHPSQTRLASLALLRNNQAAVQIQLGESEAAIATLHDAIERAESLLELLPGRVDTLALLRYARANLGHCFADLGDHAAAAEAARALEYAGDGYSNATEVATVLRVFQRAVMAAERDEALDEDERARAIDGYVDLGARYLATAVERGFSDLAALRAQDDWRYLEVHPDFARAISGD